MKRRTNWWVVALLLGALVTLYRPGWVIGECDQSVTDGPVDARTGIYKLNYQLCHWENRYNEMIAKLWTYLGNGVTCVTLESAGASDDNVPILTTKRAARLKAVGCRCSGTCTASVATVAVEDHGGTAFTLAGTLACATTGNATWQDVTGSGENLVAGEGVRFDVTNTPGSADWLTVCVELADTLP